MDIQRISCELKTAECLNCGEEVKFTEYFIDELGEYILCDNCGGSFNIDVD